MSTIRIEYFNDIIYFINNYEKLCLIVISL